MIQNHSPDHPQLSRTGDTREGLERSHAWGSWRSFLLPAVIVTALVLFLVRI
ncbi:MAG: hypothetical protein IIC78_10345 [Chloroflexi bacterium]|nr:hypothetical protein [Chloroflexota bacterium]